MATKDWKELEGASIRFDVNSRLAEALAAGEDKASTLYLTKNGNIVMNGVEFCKKKPERKIIVHKCVPPFPRVGNVYFFPDGIIKFKIPLDLFTEYPQLSFKTKGLKYNNSPSPFIQEGTLFDFEEAEVNAGNAEKYARVEYEDSNHVVHYHILACYIADRVNKAFAYKVAKDKAFAVSSYRESHAVNKVERAVNIASPNVQISGGN